MKFTVFTLLILMADCAFSQSASTDLSGLGKEEVLISSLRTGDNDIFIVNPITGNAKNITRHPAYERYPSWSSDGKKVAYNSDRDGTFNLYLTDLITNKTSQLTFEKSPVVTGMQSWPKDNSFIYYGKFEKPQPEMWRIRPNGKDEEFIAVGVDPNVSPDGRQIVFANYVGHGQCLYLMNTDKSNIRQITTVPNDFSGMHPIWSPDSKKIVYADRVGEALELFEYTLATKSIKQLTFLKKVCTSASFSPDMKFITFRFCEDIYWNDDAKKKKGLQ